MDSHGFDLRSGGENDRGVACALAIKSQPFSNPTITGNFCLIGTAAVSTLSCSQAHLSFSILSVGYAFLLKPSSSRPILCSITALALGMGRLAVSSMSEYGSPL
jgi:hypothetical protein